MNDRIDDIISVVCEFYGVPRESLSRKKMGPHYVQCARKAVCYYLKTLAGMTQRDIGKTLNRDSTTAWYHANHYEPEQILDNRVRFKVFGWL